MRQFTTFHRVLMTWLHMVLTVWSSRGMYITCLRFRYVPSIWVCFWAQNSFNKGNFSADFPKKTKVGLAEPTFIIKVGMKARQLEEGTFLKIGRPSADPRPSTSHVPPAGGSGHVMILVMKIVWYMKIMHTYSAP